MTEQKLFDSIYHSEFLLVIEKHILLNAIHFSKRSIILKSVMMLSLKRQSEKNICDHEKFQKRPIRIHKT